MKRFNIFSAIGALTIGALALTGCPTTHPDLEYLNSAQHIYLVGAGGQIENGDYFDWDEQNKAIELNKSDEDNIFTLDFTAVDPQVVFKLLVDNKSWDYQAHNGPKEITLDEEETWTVSDGGFANPTLNATTGSTYRVTVDGSSNTLLKVTVTQTSGVSTPSLEAIINSVPLALAYNGTSYSATYEAEEDGTVKFLLRDSDGVYWQKDSITVDTETTLSPTHHNPSPMALTVKKGITYSFVATPEFTDEGAISSLTLKISQLTPITDYKYIVGGFGSSTVDTDKYKLSSSKDNNFYKLPEYKVEGTKATTVFEFTNYQKDTWGGDETNIHFKLLKEVDEWGEARGSSKDNNETDGDVGDDILLDGSSNVQIDSLESGKSYKITITTTATTVSVKLEEATE